MGPAPARGKIRQFWVCGQAGSKSPRFLHRAPLQAPQRWSVGGRNAPGVPLILLDTGHAWAAEALSLKPPWVPDRRGEGERGHWGGERTLARGDVG